MKRIIAILILSFVVGCRGETSKSKKKEREKEVPFTQLRKVRTKGTPHGFQQRDYVVTQDGLTAFTTFQLPRMLRSFVVRIDLENRIPALAGFSGTYRDLEPMLALNDSILLFTSDRPLFDGDTTGDFNLWYSYFDGEKLSDPIAFDTVVNTAEDEFYPAMTDNRDLYFTAVYGDRNYDDLYVSRYDDTHGYQKPEMLDFCKGKDQYEFNAYVSPQGDLVIFTSYGRNTERGGGDLFYSTHDGEEWAEPRAVGGSVNSAERDFSPFLKGDTLFFTSKRIHGSWQDRDFKYISEIQLKADSVATGIQSVYMAPWKPLGR